MSYIVILMRFQTFSCINYALSYVRIERKQENAVTWHWDQHHLQVKISQ